MKPSDAWRADLWSVDAIRARIADGTLTRERACDGKVRFPHGAAAEKARADIEARHREPGSLRSYPCPFCAGWHFTHASHESRFEARTAARGQRSK